MYLKNIIVFLTIVYLANAAKKTYDGYKLYKVVPTSDHDIKVLNEVMENGLGEFWNEYFKVGDDVRIMVSPFKRKEFLDYLGNRRISVNEILQDIQKTVENQMKTSATRSSQSYLSLNWSQYHDLETIYKWLDELASNHPNIVRTVIMGKSVENREIKGIVINHHPNRQNRSIGVLEGTLHAREWISPATVTWIIKEFLTSTDHEIRAFSEGLEWHIFPVVNPDGYVYTFTHNRMWRKNRSRASFRNCTADNDMSNGVDLNRNFDFEWMTVGASSDPCTNTFAGPLAFSEPEARAIGSYTQALLNRGPIIYYLSFHSYTQLFIVPYSHVPANQALASGNYADMYEAAIRGAEALRRRNNTEYRVGLSADVLYPMSGTSFDWVKHATNARMSYLIELRDTGEFGFLLPPNQILPNNLEVMDGLIELDKTVRRLGYYTHTSGANIVTASFGVIYAIIMRIFV